VQCAAPYLDVPIGILQLEESELAVWAVLYLLTVGVKSRVKLHLNVRIAIVRRLDMQRAAEQ
jgi:hypothetical protein